MNMLLVDGQKQSQKNKWFHIMLFRFIEIHVALQSHTEGDKTNHSTNALQQLFQNHIAFTNDAPLALEIERAKGSYLFDKEGKSYLDLISGISVSNMGHSHPKIVEAVQIQAAKHMHVLVYGELIQNSQTA